VTEFHGTSEMYHSIFILLCIWAFHLEQLYHNIHTCMHACKHSGFHHLTKTVYSLAQQVLLFMKMTEFFSWKLLVLVVMHYNIRVKL